MSGFDEPCPPCVCSQKRVPVPEYLLRPSHCFSVENWSKNGRQMQLLIEIDVEAPDGRLIPLRILVDTGAQVNLV